jgi:hypothetical protein
MIRAVSVDRLPEGLSFPGDLQRKIHFDPNQRRLAFEGFMSKATFDRLYRLTDDREYRRALEELFQVCTFDDTDGAGHQHLHVLVPAMIGVACLAVVFALALVMFL